MSELTISVSDQLNATLKERAEAAGFTSTPQYLLALVQADCERASLDPILESRINGPFEVLERDWKQQVRDAARNSG